MWSLTAYETCGWLLRPSHMGHFVLSLPLILCVSRMGEIHCTMDNVSLLPLSLEAGASASCDS